MRANFFPIPLKIKEVDVKFAIDENNISFQEVEGVTVDSGLCGKRSTNYNL